MTKSSKINAIVEHAQALGLIVEIENHDDSKLMEAVSIKIRRNFDGTANLLEQMYTYEFITIHATRMIYDGKPRAFKLNVIKYNFLTDSTKINPTRTKFWVEMMAEDLTRYNTKIAA